MSIGPSMRPRENQHQFQTVVRVSRVVSECVCSLKYLMQWAGVSMVASVVAVHIIVLSDATRNHARESVFQTAGSWQYSLTHDYSNPDWFN